MPPPSRRSTARFDAFQALAERNGHATEGMLDELRVATSVNGLNHDVVGEIAARRRIPAAAALGPATYFSDLASRHGRRHVRVCGAAACFATTGGAHVSEVEQTLGVPVGHGDRSGDVSLQEVYCLGYCYASPACLDGSAPRVGPDLAAQLEGRTEAVDPPIPASAEVADPVVLAGIVGGQDPWRDWPTIVTSGSPGSVLAEVEASRLRGRGGAGYLVARKWRAAIEAGTGNAVLVANGDEGDPGSYADRLLMEQDPHRVLAGIALACFAISARVGIVLVRSEYPQALASIRRAVADAQDAGHLGRQVHGSDVELDIQVALGAGSYVAGEETALIGALAGERGMARARPPFPTSHGLWGAPTVVNNVETLAAVVWIVRNGGAAYARYGVGDERGTKLVCLSERFARPGCYEVELGASVRWIVADLGGGLRDGRPLRSVQVGGPLGGFLAPTELDVALTDAALSDHGAALGHAGLIAFDDRIAAIDLLRHVWRFADAESCGACSPCRVGSRRGLDLVRGDPVVGAREYARLLRVMSTASLCAFGRRVPASVRSLARVYEELAPWRQ
jgi:bidirectional [NiFe] hydrogenase diaphorase subunit